MAGKRPGQKAGTRSRVLPAKQTQVAARQRIVAKQLLKGKRQSEIIVYLDQHYPEFATSHSVISRDFKSILATLKKETMKDAGALRALQQSRLEGLHAAHWEKAIGDEENGIPPDLKAGEFCRGVIKDIRELCGLDVPVKKTIEVTDDAAKAAEDVAMALAMAGVPAEHTEAVIRSLIEVKAKREGGIVDAEFVDVS